jgi:exodeoxyribonuclease VII small subunit
MEEFETIVERLESGELTLDESIDLFEKGMKLASQGMEKLDAAERRVQVLLQEHGQERKEPFDPDSQE